jgi:hypothetical protein
LRRTGGIAEPLQILLRDRRALFFLVEVDRVRLADLAARVRDGRVNPVVTSCCYSPKLPPHSLPMGASPARRSRA